MDSIYLSPSHAQAKLATEQELDAALTAGLLEETHFLDLKREVHAGKAQNKETARDLAQFAIDGGTMIIGLEETAEGPVKAPQRLAGLAERLEQIALMTVTS